MKESLQKSVNSMTVNSTYLQTSPEQDGWIFFRRWAANPLRMGSIIPSSPALARRVARALEAGPEEYILELGAGTGAITRGLIAAGIRPERLVVVEIESALAEHLRAALPGATVLEGDARAPDLLPARLHGRIGDVICGIPLVLQPVATQRRFIDAMAAAAPGRGFLHYSYCITSPLPMRRHGLSGRRAGWTAANFPPASVWRYRPR